MDWRIFLKRLAVLVTLAGALPLGIDQGLAEPEKDLKSKESLRSAPDTQNTVYQKRKEAKQRLQKAIEARKAGKACCA